MCNFWLLRAFSALCKLSPVLWSRASLQLCTGFSLQWLLLLQSTGSRVAGLQ